MAASLRGSLPRLVEGAHPRSLLMVEGSSNRLGILCTKVLRCAVNHLRIGVERALWKNRLMERMAAYMKAKCECRLCTGLD